ncbi:MAG: molybdenum cofactor biosynthesis protein B [Gammaproteobacteria bacterium]|nr:molybdenum cofactor biosynthesis protein B [Gammaproteobacteria bacterium]
MAGARIPLNLAVVTVSDTRTMETDTSGALLAEKLRAEGHQLHSRNIVKDDVYQLRALLSKLIADPEVRGVLTTGGTGFTARDNTRKAVMPLFDVEIEGFGELFRQISFTEIGTSTVQSRAFGGIANGTVIFCLPGSTGACRTGWDHIIREQLDSTHKPCNFAERIIKT